MDTGASKKCYRVVLKITDGVSWELSNLCDIINVFVPPYDKFTCCYYICTSICSMHCINLNILLNWINFCWIIITIDNRVHKRDRKQNNVTSQNTYISIGSLCVTSWTTRLCLLRLYRGETNCCNNKISYLIIVKLCYKSTQVRTRIVKSFKKVMPEIKWVL